ncbi:hypothetical protein ACSFBI_01455 [Variovorax sp. RB3P1]|uniref:hypothetical protein n=1 Tax=Variovorax sp. RB3P1 TaxID=3443732 RepID=UPI003F48E652
MRQAIASLIEVARLNFNAKTHKTGTSVLNPPARCTPSHIAPEPDQARLKDQFTMFSLTQSPLADAQDLNPRAVDAVLAVFADNEVQRHAAEVRGKLLHLIELAALRSEVAAAVKTVGAHSNDDLTPSAVAAILCRRAAELDDALADARADREGHEAARKARMVAMAPLKCEVSKRLTALVAERDHILNVADAEKRATTLGLPGSSRFAVLQGAGLSDAQIAAIEPAAVSPDLLAERRRLRIAEIDRQTSLLRQFSADPLHDAAPLAGLGFDGLIAARNAAEQVPA